MDETLDNNKMISVNEDIEDYTFRPNFINTPWDDRTKRSKIGIICLLVAIFLATMACVINNIIMHYKSAAARTIVSDKLKCNLEKIDKYSFVARIMSPNGDLLCLGAIMSDRSVLTSQVCVKSGPILLLLGKTTLPLCKKGFLIKKITSVFTTNLVILTVVRSMSECGKPIEVGVSMEWDKQMTIIGRPSRAGKSLSRQTASLVKVDSVLPLGLTKKFNMDTVVCVRGLGYCPVQAGDLLVQNGKLYGLATISVGGINQVACFLATTDILKVLQEIDQKINSQSTKRNIEL